MKFPVCQDWEDSKEEEGNDQGKGEDNFSVCLDWDADLEEQDRKKQDVNDKKDNEGKTPKIPYIPLSNCT